MQKERFKDLRGTFTEEQMKIETSRCLGCGAAVVDESLCVGCGMHHQVQVRRHPP